MNNETSMLSSEKIELAAAVGRGGREMAVLAVDPAPWSPDWPPSARGGEDEDSRSIISPRYVGVVYRFEDFG